MLDTGEGDGKRNSPLVSRTVVIQAALRKERRATAPGRLLFALGDITLSLDGDGRRLVATAAGRQVTSDATVRHDGVPRIFAVTVSTWWRSRRFPSVISELPMSRQAQHGYRSAVRLNASARAFSSS